MGTKDFYYMNSSQIDSYYGNLCSFHYITLGLLVGAGVFLLLSFLEPRKEKMDCDIMADIGMFMWLIILMIFFNFCGKMNAHRILFDYQKNYMEIARALDKISAHKNDKNFTKGMDLIDVCGRTSANLTGCMAQFLPKSYKRDGNKITTDDGKVYTFVAQRYCCAENSYSSPGPCTKENTYRCYIDIKDNNVEGLYIRIWLDRLGGKMDFSSFLGLKEFRKNDKVLRYIGESRR